MIGDILKRGFMGIAFGGLATFIAITILMLHDAEIVATEVWFHMLGSYGLGIYFSVASLIFENENWSLLKQLCIHFPLSIAVFFLIAVPLGWVPFTIWASLLALGAFTFYYSIFWIGFWIYAKKQTGKLNEELNK